MVMKRGDFENTAKDSSFSQPMGRVKNFKKIAINFLLELKKNR